MKIRLQDEHEPEFDLVCPVHGFPMSLEDCDRSYGQYLYVCPVVDCKEDRRVGPSDYEILMKENP